jgi:hypothetical protein
MASTVIPGSAPLVSPARDQSTFRFLVLLLAGALFIAGCYTGPGADHYLAILEELSVPAGWEAAETSVRGPGEADSCDPKFTTACPVARRVYLVDADRLAARQQAEKVVTAAGFAFEDPERDSDCSSGSAGGRACDFFARRGSDRIAVRVFDSSADAGLDAGQPGLAAVIVTASGT